MGPGEELEALLALPLLDGAQVSPDARHVAWTWYGAGPAARVYSVPTDGSRDPIRLSEGPAAVRLESWAPDGASVVVRAELQGDERAQLFRIHLDRPREMVPLTGERPNHFLRGGDLHPNDRWLIYGANFDAASGSPIEPTWVYRHDLVSGERRVLARTERPGNPAPELSPTGRHVLYHRNDRHPAGRQLWVVRIDGRGDRTAVDLGDTAKVRGGWLPDGRGAIFVAESEGRRRVGLWWLAGGAITWLVDGPGREVEEAYVAPRSGAAVVVELREARAHVSLVDLAGGGERYLPRMPEGNWRPLAPAPDGRWVALKAAAREPTDLVLCRLDGPAGRDRSLTRVRRHWGLSGSEALSPAEDFRWRSVDGLPIQGWLHRARGAAVGTVVLVHGGPTRHADEELDPRVQFLCARGFHVLRPNYRGSTGFGLAFRDSIKQAGWGGREQDDIVAGIRALLDAGVARPGRVGVTGTSYGGYSAWCLAVRCPPELVAAAAPICGMTDLALDYRTTRPDLRRYSEEMMGGNPEEVPERYRDRSPVHRVAGIRCRLLIVQGLQDPNVTSENVRAVTEALDHAGVPYELLVFPDEGHGIQRRRNRRVLFLRLAAFFRGAFQAAGSWGAA
ncbi:MAG: S9 family peptidase [Planctomycetes bacterium]|nr:S9 family peptidase [Planctomycetota bacterium]